MKRQKKARILACKIMMMMAMLLMMMKMVGV